MVRTISETARIEALRAALAAPTRLDVSTCWLAFGADARHDDGRAYPLHGFANQGDSIMISGQPARFVGITPAGALWVARRPGEYERLVKRHAHLWARHAARAA